LCERLLGTASDALAKIRPVAWIGIAVLKKKKASLCSEMLSGHPVWNLNRELIESLPDDIPLTAAGSSSRATIRRLTVIPGTLRQVRTMCAFRGGYLEGYFRRAGGQPKGSIFRPMETQLWR
jgi:hypothetical protein